MNFFSKLKNNRSLPREAKRSGGFTLTELIVVITIATIIMTALVIQQSRWNDSLAVNTQAYELALMIRQAQVYSLGVKENVGATGDKFNTGYGIYINKNNLNEIKFFADKDADKKYDSVEEIASENKTFTRGVTIKDVCGSAANRCFSTSGGPLVSAHILFLRPDTKANVSLLNNGGGSVATPPVTITLRSPNGDESKVIIQANGQVSIIQ